MLVTLIQEAILGERKQNQISVGGRKQSKSGGFDSVW